MADNQVRNQLTGLFWLAVFLVSGFLTGDTILTMQRIGLFGARPPVPPVQTALRLLITVGTLSLLGRFRATLERITLVAAAAAATSTALYGFGLQSHALSAFRLISHLIAYALILFVAGQRVTAAREL
jgi:hypothetical protein